LVCMVVACNYGVLSIWQWLTCINRIISAGLIPLTVAPFAAGSLNPVTDSILCALLVVHSHIGFEYASPYSFSHDSKPLKLVQVMHYRLLPHQAHSHHPQGRHVGAPNWNSHTWSCPLLVRDQRCRHYRGCGEAVACVEGAMNVKYCKLNFFIHHDSEPFEVYISFRTSPYLCYTFVWTSCSMLKILSMQPHKIL
jgi:hypothetical protein